MAEGTEAGVHFLMEKVVYSFSLTAVSPFLTEVIETEAEEDDDDDDDELALCSR